MGQIREVVMLVKMEDLHLIHAFIMLLFFFLIIIIVGKFMSLLYPIQGNNKPAWWKLYQTKCPFGSIYFSAF